jgi:hypothetical protein
MYCQHREMSSKSYSCVRRNCSIKECQAKATSFCNKCGEAACDQHEEMMSSGMVEGMTQRTNEGYFKTGRGLTGRPFDFSTGTRRDEKAQEAMRKR